MSTFHFQPIKGQAREILTAILKSPEVASCNLKETLALRLACEEIVMNVTTYAYPEGVDGFLDVTIQKTDRIEIRFEDGGVPFNPLEQKKPDTGLSWAGLVSFSSVARWMMSAMHTRTIRMY